MNERSLGKWILPQPDMDKEIYVPIPRIAHNIPFGYELCETDPDVLQPIPSELKALEKAKKYLQQYSYREVANWLSTHTGRRISHMGLKKRIESEQSNKRRAATLRQWAERYKTAIAKAEEYETKRIGAKVAAETISDS
jgi:nucleosome binding factor SPN SPT16 subunit